MEGTHPAGVFDVNVAVLQTVAAVAAEHVHGESIATVAVFVVDPPGPEQVKLKFVDAVIAPVFPLPDVALLPDHPPDAVQLVALLVDQASVDEFPEATEVGVAVKLIDGSGVALVTVSCRICTPEDTPEALKHSRV